MNRTAQSIIQSSFLILFIILMMIGKVQFWVGFFLTGILISIWFGRVYCGWICPINTAMGFTTWLKGKLHIKSIKIPSALLNPWIRYIALAVFTAIFISPVITGIRFPVLPILFGLGILLTLLFPPELWHRYLCPFGTIMSYPAKLSRRFMRIDSSKCGNCGVCFRVCPAKAVKKEASSHKIKKYDCLECMNCSEACRKNAITYQ